MDFRLTDEQRQIQEMVREFALSEIKPHLMQWDEAQHFPTEVFKRAGGLGMAMDVLPFNLTYRKTRASVVLSVPAVVR